MEETPQKPTKKQLKLLKYIQDFTREYGFSPTYREVMNALDLKSVSVVAEHISNCEKAGFIKKRPHAARSLEVTLPNNDEKAVALFQRKLSDLDEKLKNSTSEGEKASIEDDINTLKAAAKLLDLVF